MSASSAKAPNTADEPPKKKSGKGKLILIAAPVLLLLVGAGLWFSGVLPHLLGMGGPEKKAAELAKPVLPSYVDIPEMVSNLCDPSTPRYVKLDVRVVVPDPADVALVQAAMPRLQNMLVIYLRVMKPDELHDLTDTYRLRQELLVRANTAVAPARISDILFVQLLVQ
jgi:flagellar FliL protein